MNPADMPKPCGECPWISKDLRDIEALTPTVRAAAARGDWFCCHVNAGTCWGAVRIGGARPDMPPPA